MSNQEGHSPNINNENYMRLIIYEFHKLANLFENYGIEINYSEEKKRENEIMKQQKALIKNNRSKIAKQRREELQEYRQKLLRMKRILTRSGFSLHKK